ncbi:MAG: grpE [Parachlamydiales bacterium]|nr:grpE [Parachlamydiales bacterium]
MTEPTDAPPMPEVAAEEVAPPALIPEDPMEVLQKQLQEMKDKYLRNLADGENARKRLAKEKQEIVSFGIENIICEFLPAIDNFENALKLADSASGDVKNWAVGFQMILNQFRQVLQNYGITPFQSTGCLFDPNYHDAVETAETSDVPEGTILKEFSKGYKSASRTVRPARVSVARAPRKAVEPDPDPIAAATTEN